MLIKVNINTSLIQNIRLVQALHEIGATTVIDPCESIRFSEITNVLGSNPVLKRSQDLCNITNFDNITFCHTSPYIKVANVKKTLIFPKSLFNYLQLNWKSYEERNICFNFSGFITKSRKKTLENYILNKIEYNKILAKAKLGFCSIAQIIPVRYRKFLLPKFTISFNLLKISDSINGRFFPKKSLDVEYYQQMLNSKYVLCPNGDFVWTYRFFETVMCGAIPVIEDYCDLYEGFRYKTMDEDINDLIWTEEDVKHNFELCKLRLTLNDEDIKIIQSAIADL
jgi:hypothetical protein